MSWSVEFSRTGRSRKRTKKVWGILRAKIIVKRQMKPEVRRRANEKTSVPKMKATPEEAKANHKPREEKFGTKVPPNKDCDG